MNPYELAAAVTAAAVSIANCLPDEQLDIASAAFAQLGDTLATIAIARQLGESSAKGQNGPAKGAPEDAPQEGAQSADAGAVT